MSIDSPRKENEKCLINISNDFETAREPLARDLNESKTQIKSQLENLMKKKLSLHNNNQNAAEKKNNEYFPKIKQKIKKNKIFKFQENIFSKIFFHFLKYVLRAD